MLELATSCWLICRSFLMVTVNYRIRLAGNCDFGDLLSGNYTTYQRRKRIPGQECDHEAKAGEEEHSAISINWVKDGNG